VDAKRVALACKLRIGRAVASTPYSVAYLCRLRDSSLVPVREAVPVPCRPSKDGWRDLARSCGIKPQDSGVCAAIGKLRRRCTNCSAWT
jgi:hypothetical protein